MGKKGSEAIELLIDDFVQLPLRDSGSVRHVGDGKVSRDGYGIVKHNGTSDSGRVSWTILSYAEVARRER